MLHATVTTSLAAAHRPRFLWALVFALALLLTQTLGLLHGVAHPSNQGHPHSHAEAQHDDGHEALLENLFSGHEQSADCHVYDQLSHSDGATDFVTGALPLVLQPLVYATLAGLACARWHAQFQARGPPSPR